MNDHELDSRRRALNDTVLSVNAEKARLGIHPSQA